MRDVDHVSHVGKWNRVIALDEHHFFRARLKDVGQTPCRFSLIVFLLIFTAGPGPPRDNQLHHDGAVGVLFLGAFGSGWRPAHQSQGLMA